MFRPREVIERLHIVRPVAQILEAGQISGQGLRVAADVDDLRDAVGGDFVDGVWGHAGAGRIDDDDVWLIGAVFQDFEDVAADEFAVGQAVELGVAAGGFYAFRNDFNAQDGIGFFCHDLADGAGSAVEVEDALAAEVVDQVDGFAIKALNRFYIGLEEGKQIDLEFQAEDLLHIIVSSVKVIQLVTADFVGEDIVQSLENSDNLIVQWKGKKSVFPAFCIELGLGGSYDADQKFVSSDAPADQEISEKAAVKLLMILCVSLLFAEIQCVAKNRVKIRVHQLALVHGHNRHELLLLMHAQLERPVFYQIAKGILHLVSVGIAVFHRAAFDRIEFPRRHSGVAEVSSDFPFLIPQLLFVGHALVAAASADFMVRADRHIGSAGGGRTRRSGQPGR